MVSARYTELLTLMTSGMSEATRTPCTGYKIFNNFKVCTHYWHNHHLRDAFARFDSEGF